MSATPSSLLLAVLYLGALGALVVTSAKPMARPGANFRQLQAGLAPGNRLRFFPEEGALSSREKRTSGAIPINDCVFMRSQEGEYYLDYEGDPASPSVCGAMFLAPPDQRIQLRLTLDVPCATGGVVSVTDGWDYLNQYLPMEQDHPKADSERHTSLCGVEHSQVFETSQNAAQVSYLLPAGGRFAVSVRFVRNSSPCSVIAGDSEVITLRNFGQRRNCTVTSIFPSVVRLLQLQVGVAGSHPNMEPETGTIHKCEKRGLEDYVQITGLGETMTGPETVFGSVCGLETRAGHPMSILCGVLNVRLVSSGRYDNAVTLYMKRLETEEEMLNADHVCDAEL